MPIKNKSPYGNNVYVATKNREDLESFALRAGVACGRTLSASRFVRYLLEHYGEEAVKKIRSEGIK